MKAHGWGFFSRSTVFTTLMETSDVLNKGGDMPINLFSRWHWTWTESEPNKHTRRLRWKMYMHHCLYYCVLSVSQTGLCVLALWSLINEKISHRPQLTYIWSFSLHQPPKRLFYVRDQPSGGGPTVPICSPWCTISGYKLSKLCKHFLLLLLDINQQDAKFDETCDSSWTLRLCTESWKAWEF